MSRLLRGKKFSSKCQTYTEASKNFLKLCKDKDFISKIIIGEVKPTNGKDKSMKFSETSSSFMVTILSPRQKQILYLVGEKQKIQYFLESF